MSPAPVGPPRPSSGAGLGLPLARRLAHTCGGDVQLGPGPGGCFVLDLPAGTSRHIPRDGLNPATARLRPPLTARARSGNRRTPAAPLGPCSLSQPAGRGRPPPARCSTKSRKSRIYFWLIKVLCTTVGETWSDNLTATWGNADNVMYATAALLAVLLAVQFSLKRYLAPVYWACIVVISVFGTQITDKLEGTAPDGHLPVITPIATAILALVFFVWWYVERTLSMHSIRTTRREAFYWVTILATFALGTAVGDLVAEQFTLGYLTTLLIFAAVIGVIAFGNFGLKLNAVLMFWLAYIMTRPLGASMGDFTAQNDKVAGGLGLGTTTTSYIFLGAILVLVAFLTIRKPDLTPPEVALSDEINHPHPHLPHPHLPARRRSNLRERVLTTWARGSFPSHRAGLRCVAVNAAARLTTCGSGGRCWRPVRWRWRVAARPSNSATRTSDPAPRGSDAGHRRPRPVPTGAGRCLPRRCGGGAQPRRARRPGARLRPQQPEQHRRRHQPEDVQGRRALRHRSAAPARHARPTTSRRSTSTTTRATASRRSTRAPAGRDARSRSPTRTTCTSRPTAGTRSSSPSACVGWTSAIRTRWRCGTRCRCPGARGSTTWTSRPTAVMPTPAASSPAR